MHVAIGASWKVVSRANFVRELAPVERETPSAFELAGSKRIGGDARGDLLRRWACELLAA
jgi:hypothetical protein